MDLFDSYGANCGWTLKVIGSESEYRTTVEDQMWLLVNSPAGKAGRLPASLYHFVMDYIHLLRQRVASLRSFRIDPDKTEWSGIRTASSGMSGKGSPLARPWSLASIKWCGRDEILPRSGVKLLMRWIRDLEKREEREFVTPYGNVLSLAVLETVNDPVIDSEIRRNLRILCDAIEDQDRDMERQVLDAKGAIYNIESVVLVSKNGDWILGRRLCKRKLTDYI